MALSIPAAAFVASMPASYRETFTDDEINAHFDVVSGREPGETRVDLWRDAAAEDEEGVLALCVVADDKPGLLAKINQALVAHAIDVVTAHAYCREAHLDLDGETTEAVDFLWIKRVPGARALPLEASDVPQIARMIEALAEGRATYAGSLAVVPGASPMVVGGCTTVRFEHDDRAGRAVLTIEAVDRPGLLLAVTKTLFEAGLQIVGLRATTEGGRAVDRFELAESDGKPVEKKRRFTLQTAILCAIDAAGEGRASVLPPVNEEKTGTV